MDGVFHLLEECSTTKNVILLVGLVYLLRIFIWIIRSLWSGTRAFILSGLFRVKLNSSSYGWAGKDCFFINGGCMLLYVLRSCHRRFRWNRKRICNTGKTFIIKDDKFCLAITHFPHVPSVMHLSKFYSASGIKQKNT